MTIGAFKKENGGDVRNFKNKKFIQWENDNNDLINHFK